MKYRKSLIVGFTAIIAGGLALGITNATQDNSHQPLKSSTNKENVTSTKNTPETTEATPAQSAPSVAPAPVVDKSAENRAKFQELIRSKGASYGFNEYTINSEVTALDVVINSMPKNGSYLGLAGMGYADYTALLNNQYVQLFTVPHTYTLNSNGQDIVQTDANGKPLMAVTGSFQGLGKPLIQRQINL